MFLKRSYRGGSKWQPSVLCRPRDVPRPRSFGRRHLRLPGRINLLPFAVAALSAAPASGIVYVMPTDESMVDRSPPIVFGAVRSAGTGVRLGQRAASKLQGGGRGARAS